jgi:hypothetical protein
MITLETLQTHLGHNLEIATYGLDGQPWNIGLECLTCSELLTDYEIKGDKE